MTSLQRKTALYRHHRCEIPLVLPRRSAKHVGPGFELNSTGNGKLSIEIQQAIISSDTMVRSQEARSSEGDGSSRIVAGPGPVFIERPGQSSRDLSTRNATGGRPLDHTHEFGEHQIPQNSRQGPSSSNHPRPANHTSPGSGTTPTATGDNIRTPNPTSGDDDSGAKAIDTKGGGMAGQSCVGTNVHTTLQENSRDRNQLKRAEQPSRETLLDPTTQHNHTIHRRPQENKPQQIKPSITLAALSQPLPPAHAATAAEIALGISSPYNRSTPDNDQKDTRHLNRSVGTQDESISMDTNSTSMGRSLCEGKDRDEENTSRTSETGAVSSPGRMTPLNDSSDHGASDHPRSMVGTPSTVSTAPSTDDASLGTDYKLDDSLLPHLLQGSPAYNQSQSWNEDSLLPGMPIFGEQQTGGWLPARSTLPQDQWPRPHKNEPLVATFRQDASGAGLEAYGQRYQTPQGPRGGQEWNHQHSHQTIQRNRMFPGDPNPQYHSDQHRTMPLDVHLGQGQQQITGPYQQQGGRKQAYSTAPQHSAPTSTPTSSSTPPRNSRNPRAQGQGNARQATTGSAAASPHQSNSNPQRSSSEILKTLLRKKACLYEPDTSRAVALVTWLVGRELALEYGFFSRQQLQSGVHACVAEKIDSGIITRTKVNRCMQIILNSCFHYIIPRSDGSEEKGDLFKKLFKSTADDDSFLLRYLPTPWNDLSVTRDVVIEAAVEDDDKNRNVSTPKSSPKLSSVSPDRSPGKESSDGDAVESKRAVLLCFNENVRCAEDVFRCHNEFIRDTANAAQLQLTAQEWRTFFGREAARAPYLWGNVAIPIATGDLHGGTLRQADVLGQMCQEELGKFRSTWCTKRYDHDHDLCGFAHVEVNGGWLRRNPLIYRYGDKMCSFVSTVGEKQANGNYFVLNECPEGVDCENAHSMEEILYHPNRYKSKMCTAVMSRAGVCQLGDVCPNLHPPDSNRISRKPTENRQYAARHSRKQEQASNQKNTPVYPKGSPVVYASPAPFSSFEKQLGMPGLQCLYRRQSSVVRAHVRNAGQCRCIYSCFGDDWGIYHSSPLPR